jgi:hypothetical protein
MVILLSVTLGKCLSNILHVYQEVAQVQSLGNAYEISLGNIFDYFVLSCHCHSTNTKFSDLSSECGMNV